MVLGWFNAKDADEFGKTLAGFYDEKFRANTQAADRKIATKQQKLVAEILALTAQFKEQHKPNAFQKAKLGNSFKWRMRDLGHNNELIDLLTKDILLALR